MMKQFGEFALDTSNQCLWRHDVRILLPPKPFAVLRYLVENPHRLVTHDELLEALWPDTYVQPQVLRTYMLDLRKILGDDAGQPRFIQTMPKRGYYFLAPVIDFLAPVIEAVKREAGAPPERVPYDAGNSSLVGRAESLATLVRQSDALSQHQRCVVFVTGEAGIGKTALLDAFLQKLDPGSVARACGQCIEGFGGKEEYYPIVEALRHLGSSTDGDRARAVVAELAPAWSSSLKRSSASQLPAPTQYAPVQRMPGDLCVALEEFAAEKPLVLILEDLQWADESTLHLLSALARRRGSAKLLLLATYTPHDMAAEHLPRALMHDLLTRQLCLQISLPPLPRSDVRQLVCNKLRQQALPAGLADFVHQRSEGNPFFALAICEHLLEQRFLLCQDAMNELRWANAANREEIEATLPASLQQMIEIEIARLSPQEQRLTEAGSLMRVAFPAWAVAAALDEDAESTEEACDALARRSHLVRRVGQDELPGGTRSVFYIFTHSLYRDVLYERQSQKCRAMRHIRIADRLELLFRGREADVAREMAMHYEAAASWQKAIGALRNAARHAQQQQAFAQAAELVERALRLAENLSETESASVARELCSDLLHSHLSPHAPVLPTTRDTTKNLTLSRWKLDAFVPPDA